MHDGKCSDSDSGDRILSVPDFKQVQNRRSRKTSQLYRLWRFTAAVAAAAAGAGQKETKKKMTGVSGSDKDSRSEARDPSLCAKKRGKNGNVGIRLHALRLWCFSGDLSGRCPDLSGRALDSEMEKEKKKDGGTGKWLM